MHLTPEGIAAEERPGDERLFFTQDAQGAWRASRGDLLADIEAECAKVNDVLVAAIFGNLQSYHDLLPRAPDFLFTAGLNSEAKVSSGDFERVVAAAKNSPPINRLLYLADCRKIVTGIQECTKEVVVLQGEFYRALNLDPVFTPPAAGDPDGLRWTTSPAVTRIHAMLGFIFVRLHSLLDYSARLAFEAEHMKTDFSTYPRLASIDISFADRKRIAIARVPGTLFEPGDVVAEVELYRNHIIRDGLLDDRPRLYEAVSGGKSVEKYILLPDRGPAGNLEKFKNRNLFYSRQDKINLRLPGFIEEFQRRQLATLARIRAGLE